MATYLATATVGEYDLTTYRANGIKFWDALDPKLPKNIYDIAAGSFARQPEILRFLSERFGPYPFKTSGGIVDNSNEFGFALENQTRPIYAPGFFRSPENGDGVVVHELAHQWYGDSLALARWQDIWLNEAFASYAEWMWSEDQGLGTAQETFDFYYNRYPATSPFWTLKIGDPGPEHLFDGPVYDRGAMTMHALRLAVGDRGVLPDPADLGAVPGRRQRDHAAVHRARRADLRPAAGRPVHHLAVHPVEAGRPDAVRSRPTALVSPRVMRR